ncbi:DnaJ sub B member 6 [Coemansia sp. BCRC 34962]|nr:DnaJ sub B member 6 [Coemansia sp. BCRC 34962]
MPVEFRYYELLGIEPSATADDVKRAYRKQSLKWHPDKNPGQRELAEEKFKLLAEAYSVLSDVEMRERYDKYGEDGLKRGFQPPSASGNHYSSGHHAHSSAGQGGPGFRFKSADDIFRDFFGGRDPFSSMFMESVFADPFSDPFFSQHSGSSGLRAAAEQHVPLERERRPYAGGGSMTTTSGPSMGGFGFPSMFGSGFPSMMFSSPFGGSGMPATGSFSFVSSSTIGGDGGLRSASGPSTRTSIQIVNGVKIQTTEENDGRGNVTVTKVSPDGYKEVTVNGVPQSSGSSREPPQKPIDDRGHRSYARPMSGSYARQPSPQPVSPSYGSATRSGAGQNVTSSNNESVVEVEVIEVEDSSESDTLPPPQPPQPLSSKYSAERTRGPVHKVPSPPTTEPLPKRRDPEMQKDKAVPSEHYPAPPSAAAAAAAPDYQPPFQQQQQKQKQQVQRVPAAASPPFRATQAPREPPAAQPSARLPAQAPVAPRNEAEDMLAQARNRLKPAAGTASPHQLPPQKPSAASSHGSGLKDVLKATGASLLKARPKMNRSSSSTKTGLQPPTRQAGSKTFGPVHRPDPKDAVKPQVMSAAEHKASAYGEQQYFEPVASRIDAGAARSSGGPETVASIPPLPLQQQPQMPTTGHSTPGHKQPRSRDRMRSTLHNNNFSAMGLDTQQYAGQHNLAAGSLSSPPPLPQQPLDPRSAVPGYAQYQYYQPQPSQQQAPAAKHYYGQAMYVDPSGSQPAQTSYVSPPVTANSADEGYHYQQTQPAKKGYSGQPLSATQARNQQQQQQQQQQMYGGNQYNSMSAGPTTTAAGPASGYYRS